MNSATEALGANLELCRGLSLGDNASIPNCQGGGDEMFYASTSGNVIIRGGLQLPYGTPTANKVLTVVRHLRAVDNTLRIANENLQSKKKYPVLDCSCFPFYIIFS